MMRNVLEFWSWVSCLSISEQKLSYSLQKEWYRI